MTVPEENRAKTGTTDDTLKAAEEAPQKSRPEDTKDQGASGRTLREAMEEAQVRPDDYEEK